MVRQRNIGMEREITRQACWGLTDPTALIAFAEERVTGLSSKYVPEAHLVLTDRDRPQDVREELADARNHLCWHIEDHFSHPHAPRWLETLKLICEAYYTISGDDDQP